MRRSFIYFVTFLTFCSCTVSEDVGTGPLPKNAPEPAPDSVAVPGLEVVGIAKWYQGRRSVYSPTYDTPDLGGPEIAWLLREGLSVDLEVVSDVYVRRPAKLDSLKALGAAGFGHFGHGHTHIDHDALDSASAYRSFKTNFEFMRASGLKPVSYAYPGGYGSQSETHGALRDAGFLSARLAWHWWDGDPSWQPYAMPDEDTVPRNWYMLPALYMQDIGFANCIDCVNDSGEFAAHLEKSIERKAWLISVYHGIGWDGKEGRPLGWGYYGLENFYAEMRLAKSLRDQGILWIASMDDVTLYTLERNATTWRLDRTGKDAYDLRLENALDKERFDHPLTLTLAIPGGRGRTLQVRRDGEARPTLEKRLEGDTVLVDLVPSESTYRLLVL